jgi:hypothetical protein
MATKATADGPAGQLLERMGVTYADPARLGAGKKGGTGFSLTNGHCSGSAKLFQASAYGHARQKGAYRRMRATRVLRLCLRKRTPAPPPFSAVNGPQDALNRRIYFIDGDALPTPRFLQ